MTKVVTRFAPSPTGYMHVGGVRTALFAYLFAKKNNGTFILRIEDTDKEREVEGSIGHIMESLKWLGITWDEGPDIGGPNAPYIQSERLDSYQKYAKILVEKGLAYADPYTQEELEAFRKKAEDEKRPFLYRNHRPENPPAWDGTKPLRLKIQDIKVSKWHDLVRGNLEAGPEALDDFIIIKSDGYPTYNFAHIIDDLEMGVTHIFRADEFISSTPKFLALYEALGIMPPAFVTLPPIMAADGKKKLGKRDGAKDILEYRNEGYSPDAVVNFLAFIGWNPGDEREILSREELIELFSIERIHIAGGKFNEEKLLWTNREYVKRLPDSVIVSEIQKALPNVSPDFVHKMVQTVREHIGILGEIPTLVSSTGALGFFFETPTIDPKSLSWKGAQTTEEIKKHLEVVLGLIQNATDFSSPEKIKEALWGYADANGRGNVLWPLRVSLSGKEKSPDPFVLISILGKDESISRVQNALKTLV